MECVGSAASLYTDKALLLADNDLFQIANGMRPNVAKVKKTLLVLLELTYDHCG